MKHFVSILLSVCIALITAQAAAQGPPDYDFTWRTIGSPGNAPASPTDYPRLGRRWLGTDRERRLHRTGCRALS